MSASQPRTVFLWTLNSRTISSTERREPIAQRGCAMSRWLPPLAIVLALLGAWELAARLDVIADALKLEPFLVPAPREIAQALWEDRGLLADNKVQARASTCSRLPSS